MPPPSPNPTSIFRWETASGLEHSCWSCKTKSNSPKALNTCYGIHSIPCLAYHPTMHAIGTGHRCSGCVVNRETHDCRHREIAELVAEYHAPEITLADAPRQRPVLRERPANMELRDYPPIPDVVEVEDNENGAPLEHRISKAEQRERKRAMKVERSVTKALKNEARHPIHVTMEDVERVARVLHGDHTNQQMQSHPLATDTTIEDVIERNLGFVKQIGSHHDALRASIRAGRQEQEDVQRLKRRVSEGDQDVELETVIDAILIKLGVEAAPESATKKGRTNTKKSATLLKKRGYGGKAKVVARLREAIKDDLEKHENDLHETYVRAGGFFRYAGRAVFERMTEIAKVIDLETGESWEKKTKREVE